MWLSDDTAIERCHKVPTCHQTPRLLTVTRASRPSKILRASTRRVCFSGTYRPMERKNIPVMLKNDGRCKEISTSAFQRFVIFTGWVLFSTMLAWPTVTFFHRLYRFSDSSFSEMGELRKSFFGRKQLLCFSFFQNLWYKIWRELTMPSHRRSSRQKVSNTVILIAWHFQDV